MLVQIGQDVLSLDEPITEDNASSLMDLVEDPNSVSILDVLQYMASVEELDDLLARLTPREEKVIRLRYGLREHRPLSLDEIGARVGLTRERIRQIEMKAMGILRKHWKLASR
jgi:RNA polymerase primary sigma factor